MSDTSTKATTPMALAMEAAKAIDPRIGLWAPKKFRSDAHAQVWLDKRATAVKAADEAWSTHVPGTTLYVSAARGLSRRARGGVVFGAKGATEVEVVDLSGAELAELQKSRAVVNPLGAAAILADDSLIVHGEPPAKTKLALVAATEEAKSLRSENERLRAELAARSTAPNDGRPQRLGKGKASESDEPKG